MWALGVVLAAKAAAGVGRAAQVPVAWPVVLAPLWGLAVLVALAAALAVVVGRAVRARTRGPCSPPTRVDWKCPEAWAVRTAAAVASVAAASLLRARHLGYHLR